MNDLALKSLFSTYKQTSISGRYITLENLESVYESLNLETYKIELGYSVLQKPIHGFKLGDGSTKILMWSQMHGNESTTTKALLDFIAFLVGQSELTSAFLKNTTLLMIPMLNPDGAAVYTRENANNIDLNRDFVDLSQPESQLLMRVFEDFKPDYCFNLHDQRTIYGVGTSGLPATVSFLSPAFNEQRDLNDNRIKAMQVIVAMNNRLKAFIPNQIGRFDDGFNRNCVGDTFQSFGVPTILFEAGHFQNDYEREQTRFYIFIALFESILRIYENDIVSNDFEDYMQIPQNNPCFFDFVYRNVKIRYENSDFITNFAAQYVEEIVSNKWTLKAKIVSMGDLRNFKGHVEIDAKELIFDSKEGKLPFINQNADFMLGNNIEIVNGLIKM
uniref:M14 family metallopeptidase n=1 Tax=Flavobacterium sp. TaxID=239 RepID=UPI004049E513